MVWSKLGVNYQGAQANWAADINYLKSIGLQYVRVSCPSVSIPWAVGSPSPSGSAADVFAFWRACAIAFLQGGLHVTWGPSSPQGNAVGNLTATRWSQYHDAVVAEATYLQSQGVALDDFEIGNELELFVDGTTLTIAQLNANLRQLASDVKAVYTLSPISYAAIGFGSTLADWLANGLGGLDFLSTHPYTGVLTDQNYAYAKPVQSISGNFIASMVAGFGNKYYISEFNLDGGSSNILMLTPEQQLTAMRNYYTYIKSSGVTKAYIFVFNDYLDTGSQYTGLRMRNPDGSFNPMWEIFLSDNHRLGTIAG